MNLPGPAAPLEPNENEASSQPSPSQWLRLAEYGEWPHPGGLQRFTRNAARDMVDNFRSLRGRLARRFGGLPLYIGHPDDASFAGRPGHQDTRAYAWIRDLQARADGLYILPRWSEEGRHLLADAFYKFLSPRWALHPQPDGSLVPVRLVSVGLTNHPNIPGEAIANQQSRQQQRGRAFIDTITPENEPTMLRKLIHALNLDPLPDSEEALLSAAKELTEASVRAVELDAENLELTEENTRLEHLVGNARDELQRERERFLCERHERIDLLLAEALRAGNIAANEAEAWREGLRNDFDAGVKELNALSTEDTPALNTESRIQNLVTANTQGTPTGSRRSFLALVNERMRETGEDFATAWCTLKQENPQAYNALAS
ncbi:MAG: phage protease [Opitutales bacterium]